MCNLMLKPHSVSFKMNKTEHYLNNQNFEQPIMFRPKSHSFIVLFRLGSFVISLDKFCPSLMCLNDTFDIVGINGSDGYGKMVCTISKIYSCSIFKFNVIVVKCSLKSIVLHTLKFLTIFFIITFVS